jgi:hypothetical protein
LPRVLTGSREIEMLGQRLQLLQALYRVVARRLLFLSVLDRRSQRVSGLRHLVERQRQRGLGISTAT